MEGGLAQDTGDREKEQANQDLILIPKLTPNPETSLLRTFRGERVTSNPSKTKDTKVISPEGKWKLTRNGITNKKLAPVSQRITNLGSRKPGIINSNQQKGRRVLDPRSTSPGTSPGTNKDKTHNSNTLDLQENFTVISSYLGKATRETLEKEEEIGETQVRNMTIGNHRKGTILKSM